LETDKSATATGDTPVLNNSPQTLTEAIENNDSATEQTPLLGNITPNAGAVANTGGTMMKNICGLAILFVTLAAVTTSILLAYFDVFHLRSDAVSTIKIFSLNTWDMPGSVGSEFKSERMDAIAKEIKKGKFDVYLLQELWMEPDHDKIASNLPIGYNITGFRQLSPASCDGRVLPTSCSGLSIISRFPFEDVEFHSFAWKGNWLKMSIDGEVLVGKGVGRVRVTLNPDITVDIFITHLVADPEPSNGYSNSYYRQKQIQELINEKIAKSNADMIFLGGDFESAIDETNGSEYEMVHKKI